MSDKVDAILKKSIDDVARDVPGYRSVLTRREAIAVKSDLDFLISFSPSARAGDVEDVRVALEYATGRGVDVVSTLDGQSRQFRDSATRDGVKILG